MTTKKPVSTATLVVGRILLTLILAGVVLFVVASGYWFAEHVTNFALRPNKEDAGWALVNVLSGIWLAKFSLGFAIESYKR